MTFLDDGGQPRVTAEVLAKLSTSDRRLIRELTLKLAEAHEEPTGSATSRPVPVLCPHVIPWLSYLLAEGKSPATLRNYHIYTRLLLDRFPSPTEPDIRTYLGERAAAGTRPVTLALQVCAVKSFTRYLTEMDILPGDIAARIRHPKEDRRERKPAVAADVAQLLDSPATTTRDRVLIILLADCGLRLKEALTLRPRAIDLPRAEVSVLGKGNKERTVPMSDVTAAAVKSYADALPTPSEWLFPGRRPGQHLTTNAADRRFQWLCARAGISPFTPHQLRHYYATSMLNDGANLRVVSELLGHASPSITANVYWHSIGADQRRHEHELHNPLRGIINQAHSREAPPDDTDEMG